VDTSLVTEEGFLGTEQLFGFGFRVLEGLAFLRAHGLGTNPKLLAVWDGQEVDLPGGTWHNMNHWPGEVAAIRLDQLPRDRNKQAKPQKRADSVDIATVAEQPSIETNIKRELKTMLFADVVGFSRLEESSMPYFMHRFLAKVAQRLDSAPEKPEAVNTWGDAIFAVMPEEKTLEMAEYALGLQEVVRETDWTGEGMPAQMSTRIALHVGPVYCGTDPITEQENFYGSHVNRAARIEPITEPGCVYVSESFAALVTLQLIGLHPDGKFPYELEYVGKLALPKSFGFQKLFQLRRAQTGSRSLP
jgi:class 3 adenylate cyclase